MFRLKRVEQYCKYEDLDEGSRLNAIYQLEDIYDNELQEFIDNYINNKIKDFNGDEYELQLLILDLETTDEAIIVFCNEKNLLFNSLGDLINNEEDNKKYKENPYNQF